MIQKIYFLLVASLLVFLPYAWFEPRNSLRLLPVSLVVFVITCVIGLLLGRLGGEWRNPRNRKGLVYLIVLSLVVFAHIYFVRGFGN
jgi:hypothetical protein